MYYMTQTYTAISLYLTGVLALLLSFTSLLQAQDIGVPFMVNYTEADYRGHVQNWSLAQQTDGVLYMGNTNGNVLTYDGTTWRSILVGKNAIIRSLALGSLSGRIYVGAIGDFGFLEKRIKKGSCTINLCYH